MEISQKQRFLQFQEECRYQGFSALNSLIFVKVKIPNRWSLPAVC